MRNFLRTERKKAVETYYFSTLLCKDVTYPINDVGCCGTIYTGAAGEGLRGAEGPG